MAPEPHSEPTFAARGGRGKRARDPLSEEVCAQEYEEGVARRDATPKWETSKKHSKGHLAQTIEQGFRILLVTSLARIVGAQRQAAHAGQLLGRDLGILLLSNVRCLV